jgi:hypothetical protein
MLRYRRGPVGANISCVSWLSHWLYLHSMSTTETQWEGHEDDIISAVRKCLVDESPDVRVAAAQAFDTLQGYIGNRAIDQTIPTLLEALRRPGAGSGTALQALREIMTVRFPSFHLLPISDALCRSAQLPSSPYLSLPLSLHL